MCRRVRVRIPLDGFMITLKPKSATGKNRISQFGEKCTIVHDGMFQGKPALLLEHVDRPDRLRWVHKENDKDFEIKSAE